LLENRSDASQGLKWNIKGVMHPFTASKFFTETPHFSYFYNTKSNSDVLVFI
jgi:hypothetical protein